MAKMTRKQTEYYGYMKTIMEQLEWDLHDTIWHSRRVPPAWAEIANTRYAGKKTRVTLLVEENVVRFFKSMGTGYQARMNEVLAAWMYARLSGILNGQDTVAEFLDNQGDRPGFG
ncbi:BrnA antitoxin family protein [Lacimonas salitolerans]|uniref:BrnA antitoxin family protein n=1 Tax=Lacimonas salitolerans TaxID=1323750 RepID=A0ABW4ECB4_9RHOB